MAQWRHEWVPLTPAAAREKNHGSKPGPNSKIARMMKAAKKGGAPGAKKPSPSSNQAAKPNSPARDVEEATKAIKAGDRARAVNLLTRAMNNSTGAERKAIKAQRDELVKRLMGRR
jgi:hypothetical protein